MTFFSETLGQPKAIRFLSRSLENGRLAHAYLFRGPEGVGKKTTARKFSAALLCKEGIPGGPCGQCSCCIQFMSGNNPDFLHIRPQGAAIKIDQIRSLKKELGFPPLESPRRVILLEDVHTMKREAGNSLLKMLEEPPPDNILLLTAIDAEPLLPTILSRCQVIPFFPLPHELAAEIIARQNSALDYEEALQLARLTGGCPGIVRTFDTADLLPMYNKLVSALIEPGKDQAERVEQALLLARECSELKEGLEQLFDLLRMFLKESMLASLRGKTTRDAARTGDRTILLARERWNLTQLSDKLQVIDFVTKALARNCNRLMVCEVLFLKLLDQEGTPAAIE